jgi:hypothetical protein
MPVFGHIPWLPGVVFQLSLWVPLATINAVQPTAWPSWEHLIWVYSPYGPLELSLVLSVLKPPPHSGPASTPDCPKKHLIWVDLIRICPLGFRADFPLELLLDWSMLYCILCICCMGILLYSAMMSSHSVLQWFDSTLFDSFCSFILQIDCFDYCSIILAIVHSILLHLFLSPKEVTISITVSSQ